MLPVVDFCGVHVTRLILGANPFGGFSHQNRERDEAMKSWHTPDRIRETWARAEAAGINTIITNNETPHVIQTVEDYLGSGGRLQWIGQLSDRPFDGKMEAAVDHAVSIGATAFYFHGGWTDRFYQERDEATLRRWCDHARATGVPVGVAGHSAAAHLWVDSLDCVDFHVVCFFNCGSLHAGRGDRFQLSDMQLAVDAIQRIRKPCIGYKIMGAGRIDPRMAFEYAFDHIKPGDVVNVGVHRGDKDGMVEENVALVEQVLEARLEPVA
ncbi:MAG: hypothetical protein HYU66_03020 [Armatimonadetes bacterium]|nr:hypothetical protein [Armatimonadota bacterium]